MTAVHLIGWGFVSRHSAEPGCSCCPLAAGRDLATDELVWRHRERVVAPAVIEEARLSRRSREAIERALLGPRPRAR